MGRDLGAIGKERLVRLVMLGRPGNGATPGMGGKVENIHAWRQDDCRYVNLCIH